MSRPLILVLSLCLGPVAAQAQATDAEFFKRAADAGVRDVAVARYAMEKASNADVWDFARRVAIDRSRVNEELLKLSQGRSVSLDAAPLRVDLTEPLSVDKAASVADAPQLSGIEGVAFDRAFLEDTLKTHEEAIDLFDEVADKGQDQEVKAWAERVHQNLQDLVRRAKHLLDRITAD